MLTQVDVQRRRIGGAVAGLIGIVLIVLAILAFTGSLGATTKSEGASEEAQSAGAQPTEPADPSATGDPNASGEADESAEPPESADPSGSETSGTQAPTDAKAPLTVLNGGGIGGLAAAGQTEFEAGGWEVTEIGNYTGAQIEQSTVFYPSGDDDAQAAAEALAAQFDQLVAEQAPSGLGYDGVVVVLAGEWVPGG